MLIIAIMLALFSKENISLVVALFGMWGSRRLFAMENENYKLYHANEKYIRQELFSTFCQAMRYQSNFQNVKELSLAENAFLYYIL